MQEHPSDTQKSGENDTRSAQPSRVTPAQDVSMLTVTLKNVNINPPCFLSALQLKFRLKIELWRAPVTHSQVVYICRLMPCSPAFWKPHKTDFIWRWCQAVKLSPHEAALFFFFFFLFFTLEQKIKRISFCCYYWGHLFMYCSAHPVCYIWEVCCYLFLIEKTEV